MPKKINHFHDWIRVRKILGIVNGILLAALLSGILSPPIFAFESTLSEKIEYYDELTFDDPARVVKEGTLLFQSNPGMTAEDIIGLSVVIAESAGLYGKSETVWEWVERGLALIDQVDKPVLRIRLYSLAGVALEFQGKSKEAREYHLKAIDLAVKTENLQWEGYSRELFTYFANREADYLVVVQNVKILQEIYQKLPQSLAYYNSRAAVGLFFASPFFKRYDEGIALIKESIRYFEEHNKKFLAFNYSNSLAGVYASINPEEGIRFGLQLIEKYPETPDMPYPQYLSDSLGESYFKLQRYPEALRYFLQSAEFWRSNGDNKLYYAELMLSVCRAYIKLKQYDKAWNAFETIKDFPKEASLINQQTWLELQVELWRHKENPVEEMKVLRKLFAISEKYHEEQNAELSQKMAAQFDVVRIEEQKRILQFANQEKTKELERVARTQKMLILISFMILFMLVLALLYIRKRHEAMEKQQALQEILDTIEEGIVRIGLQRRILPYHSRATQAFLSHRDSLVGQEILPILLQHSNLSRDQIQIAHESLNTILGENLYNWEFNSVHLPQQIKIDKKVLSLAWQPTIRQGLVANIILTIVDITQHMELEEVVRLERQRNNEFHELVSELRSTSLELSMRFLHELQDHLQESTNPLRFLLSNKIWLHTQKGNARSLGLKRLSTYLHQLESMLNDAMAEEKLPGLLHSLQASIQEYFSIAHDLGSENEQDSGKNLLGLCSEIFEGLKPSLLDNGLKLQEINVSDQFNHWDRHRLDTLREILIHAITNSIDHGFIRGRSSTAIQDARFAIQATVHQGQFSLVLRDNGQGLNWEKITALATQRGMDLSQRSKLTSILFEDGVSTTGSVSLLSGRGLGLTAVRKICEQLQGTYELQDNTSGSGTQLTLSWPLQVWEKPEADPVAS